MRHVGLNGIGSPEMGKFLRFAARTSGTTPVAQSPQDRGNPSIQRFIRWATPGKWLLAPMAGHGPVLACQVQYNNGRKLILSNPLAPFGDSVHLRPQERTITTMVPLLLPRHPDFHEQDEARLATLADLNAPLVRNARNTPATLWRQHFEALLEQAHAQPTPVLVGSLTKRTQLLQPVGFTLAGELVLVPNPQWKPRRWLPAPLTGKDLHRQLPKALWPQVRCLPMGQQVTWLVAPPGALRPVLSDFKDENGAFVPAHRF